MASLGFGGRKKHLDVHLIMAAFLFLFSGAQALQWKAAGPFKNNITSIVSCADSLLFALNYTSLFSSRDSGAAWTFVAGASLRPDVKTRLMAGSRTVYMIFPDSAIYRSGDCGITWNRMATFNTARTLQGSAARNDTVVFMTQDSGLYISYDNGSTWSNKSTTGLGSNFTIYDMAVSSTGIYAGMLDGIHRILFNDSVWQRVDTGAISAITVGDSVICAMSQFDYMHAVVLHCSYDGGATWSLRQFETDMTPKLLYGNNIFVVYTSNGLFVSKDNARSWVQQTIDVNTGIDRIDGCWFAAGRIFLSTYRNEMHLSRDFGKTWDAPKPCLAGMRAQSLLAHNDTLFAAGNQGGICTYDPAGQRWNDVGLAGLAYSTSDNWPYFYSLRIAGISDNVLLCQADRKYIFRLPSNQTVWHQVVSASDGRMNDAKMTSDSSVVFGTGGWCFPPNCLCIDVFGGLTSVISSDGLFATCGTRSIYTLPSCSQSIYAVGGWQNAVLAGTDYGIQKFSWTDSVWARTSPLHSSRIRLIKEATGMMIAASLHELFVSFDRGTSWKQRVAPSATDSVNAIAGINGTIIAGTPGGVFYSRDSGATWSALATPFYSAGILDLAIINTTLFAGTNGAGVYMTDVKDIIGSTNLSGRHPQSPSLRIARVRQSAGVVEYAVTTEQAQPLTVRVFDGLGRTLYQKEYGAAGGPSTIAIPRGRLPRGLCFVQIGTAAGRNIFKECLVNGK